MTQTNLIHKLKENIILTLNLIDVKPEDIGDEMPLFGTGLELDSIDSLELIVMLERNYNIKITDPKQGRKILVNVKIMAEYIQDHSDNKNSV